jgi:predicted ester cyclase
MTPEESKAKTRWFVEELNKCNLDSGREVYSSDCLFHYPPGPDVKGLDAWNERFARISTVLFPDFKITIDEMIVEGNTAVTRLTYSGTHTGQSAAFPFPPTGKKALWTGCAVGHGDGEKTSEVWEYVDMLGLLQQLGIIPPLG